MRARLGMLVLACAACHAGRELVAPTRAHASASFVLPEPTSPAPAAPIALTATDGTGLSIAKLAARSVVKGPLVETELALTFENLESRRLEGRFRIALPPRAFTSRLAMKIEGKWVEADVAELGAARDVYEDVMHRRRDPLLVEQKHDNELTARVFPIEPRARKEIIVAWVAEVSAENPVTIPLRGLPAIGEMDVAISGDRESYEQHDRDAAPADDVRFRPTTTGPAIVRTGDAVVARVVVPGEDTPQPIESLLVMLDTSASRARELASDVALVADLAKRLAPNARLVVAAFDQSTQTMFDGPMHTFDETTASRLRERGALGASDRHGALAWARATIATLGRARMLFVGDGIATAGETSLPDVGAVRVDAIATSALRDEASLRSIAKHGLVIDGATPAEVIARRLERSVLAPVKVAVPGARFVSPEAIDDAQPGDERFVYADVPSELAPRVVVGSEAIAASARATAEPVLPRAVAKAKIDRLVGAGAVDAATEKTVVALSKKHRVASPFTAMVVLETDADRRALAHAEASGKQPPPPPPAPPVAKPVDVLAPPPPPPPPSASVRRLPPVSHHVAKAPLLRMGTTVVNGRLPPESIRVVVRSNFGRFRGCYVDGLLRNPKLKGRIATKFVIGRDGAVREAASDGSDFPDPAVIACVVDAFRGLVFAKPEGGIVTVTYPIVFRPEGEETDLPSTPTYSATRPYRPYRPTAWEPPPPPEPWWGPYRLVHDALNAADVPGAFHIAAEARSKQPFDLATMLALGEAFEAAGLPSAAARAYGSIADVFPHRAEALRIAATRLRRLSPTLAIDLFARARDDRPDEPSSHHLLAMAYLDGADYAGAADALERGLARGYGPRFPDARDTLAADLALVAHALRAGDPKRAAALDERVIAAGGRPIPEGAPPAEQLVLTWETDASNVTLDTSGASFVTSSAATWDGFGPKLVVLDGEATIGVTYARRGPTAAETAGVVDVLKHDGRGHVTVEPRPFFVMNEGASLRLGRLSPSSDSLPRSPN